MSEKPSRIGRNIARGESSQAAGNDIYNNFVTVQRLRGLPAVLGNILPVLAERTLDTPPAAVPERYRKYSIEGKIEYNSIVIYRGLIDEYAQYGGIIDEVYQKYDDIDPKARRRLMRYFQTLYFHAKADVLLKVEKSGSVTELDWIRENSDMIMKECIDRVTQHVREACCDGDDNSAVVYQEDIGPVCSMIVCHAFVLCKVLERPEDDN